MVHPITCQVPDLFQTVSNDDFPDGSVKQTIWCTTLHHLFGDLSTYSKPPHSVGPSVCIWLSQCVPHVGWSAFNFLSIGNVCKVKIMASPGTLLQLVCPPTATTFHYGSEHLFLFWSDGDSLFSELAPPTAHSDTPGCQVWNKLARNHSALQPWKQANKLDQVRAQKDFRMDAELPSIHEPINLQCRTCSRLSLSQYMTLSYIMWHSTCLAFMFVQTACNMQNHLATWVSFQSGEKAAGRDIPLQCCEFGLQYQF